MWAARPPSTKVCLRRREREREEREERERERLGSFGEEGEACAELMVKMICWDLGVGDLT